MSEHNLPASEAPKGKQGDEKERKWLVPVVPEWVNEYPPTRIKQGYAAIEPKGSGKGTEVRLRSAENPDGSVEYSLTIKSKELARARAQEGDGLSRAEREIFLDRGRFDMLWDMTVDRRIDKNRRTVEIDGHKIEVDEYLGSLAGHVVAEVEFPPEADAYAYHAPDWFGQDVTNVPALKNQQLATEGWPQRIDE